MKRTKVVCTIGPASDKKNVLKQMVRSGMNCARLNFSHNTQEYHLNLMKKIRAVSNEVKMPVGIIADLQGPRIRVGELPEKGLKLVKNKNVTVTANGATKNQLPIVYKNMHKEVAVGERILIADGVIELKVERIREKKLFCKVVRGGLVISHKGVNLPDTKIKLPTISEKDKEDIFFAVKNKVDFIALSFVRKAQDVVNLRELIKQVEEKLHLQSDTAIKIIVKIERKEALENLDDIFEEADAVMVARGDLGVELSVEDVPVVQKMIVDKCLQLAKPVIVATHLLDSMIKNPRPTRAEASDVANAVIDHADAVMLSGETALGEFPVETVTTMSKIIEKTEDSTYDDLVVQEKVQVLESPSEAIGRVAKMLSLKLPVELILGTTQSGYTASIVSRYRPELPIYMGCPNQRLLQQLTLFWGIIPFKITGTNNKELISRAKNYLKRNKLIKAGEKMIVVSGIPQRKTDTANFVEIQEV